MPTGSHDLQSTSVKKKILDFVERMQSDKLQ